MRLKAIKIIAFAAIVIITAKAFSSYAEASEDRSYPAEVEDISGERYFPQVKQALSQAKESVFMVMFMVGLRPYDKDSSIYQLVDELVRAHERGVKVTVILDQNIAFVDKERIDEWQVEGKNAWCFKMLKEAGIAVWYDEPTKYAHAKTIVIDGETIILGSANWTRSGLFNNFETNVLIKSKELAAEFLENFKKIELDKKAGDLPIYLEPPIPISWKFLEKPKLAGEMTSRHDERPQFLSKEEIERLLQSCTEGLYPFVYTALNTGMRSSELVYLRWKDVDLDKRKITVHSRDDWQSKSGKSRTIDINDNLFEFLKKYKHQRSEYVFCTEGGHPLVNNLNRRFRNTAKRARLSGISIHNLRHTFASHLVMAGVPLATVSKLLGHADIKTTMIYAHLSPDHLKEAVNKLDF